MIRPINDRVIIKRDEKDLVKGGLLLVGKYQAVNTQGTVVAVGPGRKTKSGRVPAELKVGDTVMLPIGDNIPKVLIDGREYLDMREKDILGVVELCHSSVG